MQGVAAYFEDQCEVEDEDEASSDECEEDKAAQEEEDKNPFWDHSKEILSPPQDEDESHIGVYFHNICLPYCCTEIFLK